MATIVTRSGKGAPLTNAEVDANFTNLNTDKVETSAISTFGGSLVSSTDAATARTTLGLGTAATTDSTAYATAAQGSAADTALQPGDAVPQTSATGAAVIPVGTAAQRPTPATGQLRFNTDAGSFEGYNGTEWGAIGGGGGGAVDDIFYENAQEVSADYTISATRNAMTTGPITIDPGVTVTVSSGARWVII
jgi:hypothetical protein